MKKLALAFLMIFVAAAVDSCSFGSMRTSPPEDGSVLKVTAPAEGNSFQINDIITVIVQNMSDDQIAFLPDQGITLLVKAGDKWQMVDNLMSNSVPRRIVLSPGTAGIERSLMTVPVIPKVPRDGSVIVRIVVSGVDQATQQEVTGSVDVTLSP